MNEKDILKNVIKRLKNEYVRPLIDEKTLNEFDEGTLTGLSIALTVIQNELSTVLGEEVLEEYEININCDTFSDM